MINPATEGRMEESGLPWTVFGEGENAHHVQLDAMTMVRDSLERFAELGCKTAGLMIPSYVPTSPFLEALEKISSRLGIAVEYEWILVARESHEQTGYEQFCALWELRKKPEGLMVFPDLSARGVVSVVLKKRIRFPEDLRLILHRNAESPFVVPMPCDFIEVSVQAIATRLTGPVDPCSGSNSACGLSKVLTE